MATLTVENYVKTVYQICNDAASATATTGEIARRLEVSPGSVTSMLRTLAESGLANYQAYEGVRLTETGNRLALRVLRRHRLIELFLVRTLGLTWDEVHEEAEHLEHAVSERLVDRLDEYLGRPSFDPHGDPIPRADGTLNARAAEPLAGCPPGAIFRLTRVLDQSPEFLRYLSQAGLEIGAEAVLAESHPSAGALVVAVGAARLSLGRLEAGKMMVERVQSSDGPSRNRSKVAANR